MSISKLIYQLVEKGIEVDLIDEQDTIYVQNQVAGLLNLDSLEEIEEASNDKTIPDSLEDIVAYAIETNVIKDILDDKEILSSKIMDCFMPRPSDVNRTFQERYEQSPEHATNYFYELSKNSNYIQMKRINKNIHFKADTAYGDLDITINLSKPEKDPEQIKREREVKQDIRYPKCLLCMENEGYVGRTGHPARSNHRIIKVPLEGENWYLQYSPYVYYNEHSILFAEEHRNMKIDKGSFERLTSFVEKFPHYFIGSNADLPIVGGSILNHDHYQAGRYEFAMTRAKDEFIFELNEFPSVKAAVVHWPLSVIRLRSNNRKDLVKAGAFVLDTWRNYSDPSVEIHAFTGDKPHNTITPIARKRGNDFELDLVLRNNRTTDEHPLGVFHPHAEVHHIKKENIGLIEVMGLAVLPARLKDELEHVKRFLLNKESEVTEYHKPWAEDMKTKYTSVSTENIDEIIEIEVGKKFAQVLEDAGVFKTTEQGRTAFRRFIYTLNNS